MGQIINLLAVMLGAKTKTPAKPAAVPAVRIKSPERIANEKTILDTRRKILADLAALEKKTGTKLPHEELFAALLRQRPEK